MCVRVCPKITNLPQMLTLMYHFKSPPPLPRKELDFLTDFIFDNLKSPPPPFPKDVDLV